METSPFRDGFPFSKRKSEPAPAPEQSPEKAPRQTLVAKATVRPDVSVTMPTLVTTGFVSNISMHGIGFHTRRPLAIGENYQLNLELGPVKWASRLKVVSCQPHTISGTFDVGAEFVGNDLMSRTKQMAA